MKPQDAVMFNTTASMLQDEFHTKELAKFSAVNSKLDVNRTLEHVRDVITDLMYQYAKSPVHQCMCGDGWYVLQTKTVQYKVVGCPRSWYYHKNGSV